jgi:tetratricopeptide (TPR) repeat protein
MNSTADPTGTIETALAHTKRLLATDPLLAAEQAEEVLKVLPQHPLAMLFLGIARRLSGDCAQALQTLQPLVDAQPKWAEAHYQLGIALAEHEQPQAALDALRRAVALNPDLPDAWRAIGDHLIARGDAQGADAAYARHIKASTRDPKLLIAASALVEGRIAQAEALLRTHLKQYPTDVAAIRMLAEVAARLGRNADAESLLESCLELAPGFHAARHQYAIILQRRNKPAAALHQIDQLEKLDSSNPNYRNLRAVVLGRIGGYAESIELYAEVLKAYPQNAKIWLSYGHTLVTAGRDLEAIAAYRQSIEWAPHLGEAYWSLANLKTFKFTDQEKQAMRAQLARSDLSEQDRYHFDFAMGKALEDDREYLDSFNHYLRANELRRARSDYDASDVSEFVRHCKELFTREFFAARAGHGAAAPDPIFIVGLPRAGSTLIEQILASHSQVEGTMELPDLVMIVEELGGRPKSEDRQYPGVLASLSAEACRKIGEDYLERTRIQRKTAKPLFIDKMPNNFLHVGLIRLALPNAKVIDARRHPMACCFSAFKQHFAEGHRYSYSLEDTARYYRDYVELMDHFDRVIPGKVHRVIYERMIDDTDAEIGRLLAYCGLPFESACLRFHENQRPVRTPSAQQVRQPIYRDGVEHWRHYQSWLRPLEEALGDVLGAYPAAPRF